MISFAAIVPHSPLLLPTIGRDHQKKLKKTLAAYASLEEELYASKPDTIVLFSPHGTPGHATFPLFIAPSYRANLQEFGDVTTVLTFKSDLRTLESLRRLKLGGTPVPLSPRTDEFLDYGSAVPLYFLAAHLPHIRIVPIGISSAALRRHLEVGKRMSEIFQQTNKRIALIASADLAHTLTDDAPGGFNPAGKKFDEAMVQILRMSDLRRITSLDREADAAKACGLKPIAMLLGALAELNCTSEPLSYEGPFGVGYLVARFYFR